jgi:hypothetical protein
VVCVDNRCWFSARESQVSGVQGVNH